MFPQLSIDYICTNGDPSVCLDKYTNMSHFKTLYLLFFGVTIIFAPLSVTDRSTRINPTAPAIYRRHLRHFTPF